jgi:hypothetical protein
LSIRGNLAVTRISLIVVLLSLKAGRHPVHDGGPAQLASVSSMRPATTLTIALLLIVILVAGVIQLLKL